MQAEIRRLQEDLRAAQPYTRKRVREPPNNKFARMKDIIEAEEASRKPLKRARKARTVDPAPIIEEAQETIVHALDRIHEIEEMD